MADHVRKQLRDAVVTALTGLATTGANAFGARVYPLQDAELPALRIFTNAEQANAETIHLPTLVGRVLELVVEGVAKATADLDDTLDAIAKEVETALAPGVVVGSKTIALVYGGCDIELSGEGEKATGSISMRFEAKLINTVNTPDILS